MAESHNLEIEHGRAAPAAGNSFRVYNIKPHYQCKPDGPGPHTPGCADKIKPAMKWAIETGAEILVMNEVEAPKVPKPDPAHFEGVGFVCVCGSFADPVVAFINKNTFTIDNSILADNAYTDGNLPYFDNINPNDVSKNSCSVPCRPHDTRPGGMIPLTHRLTGKKFCLAIGTFSHNFDNDPQGVDTSACPDDGEILYVVDSNINGSGQTISMKKAKQLTNPARKCDADPFMNIETDNGYFYDRIAMCGGGTVTNPSRNATQHWPEGHVMISADVTL